MTTSTNPSASDPAPRPKRRSFSPEYRLRLVAEYDAAPKNEKGTVLRRERPYHSHATEWQSAAELENEKLRRQVERLEKELARNKAALEVLGKAPRTGPSV